MLEGILIRGLFDTGPWRLALHTQPGGRIGPRGGIAPIPSGNSGCQWQTLAHSRAYEALVAGVGASHRLSLICGDLRVAGHPNTHQDGPDDAVACTDRCRLVHQTHSFSIKWATQTATISSTSGGTEAAQVALLQGVQVTAESICFVQIANRWSHHTVCFEPSLKLPLCLSSSPTLATGPSA